VLENEFVRVSVTSDGTLDSIFDKRAQREAVEKGKRANKYAWTVDDAQELIFALSIFSPLFSLFSPFPSLSFPLPLAVDLYYMTIFLCSGMLGTLRSTRWRRLFFYCCSFYFTHCRFYYSYYLLFYILYYIFLIFYA
jgi:hypothetical protein